VTETNVFQLTQPGAFADPLTEVLRNGARTLLAQAVEAEVAALLASHADKLTEDGCQRLVRHGHLPEREIMTGIGPVAVAAPACAIVLVKAPSVSAFRRRFCRPTHADRRASKC
jgi:putative transposase